MAPQSASGISRRAVLRVAGGVLLGAASMPLVAACAPGVPAAGSGAPTSGGGTVKLPTYVTLPNLPGADLPGTPDGLLAPGYQRYPANLIKSVPQPPGKGTEVNALTASLSPAPTPMENNPAWQQVNKGLGVTLKIPSITTPDYPTRLNTVVAGADLPDIIAAFIFSTTMPSIGDFLNSACADLTPYLSGDAVKTTRIWPTCRRAPGRQRCSTTRSWPSPSRPAGSACRRSCLPAGATWRRPASPRSAVRTSSWVSASS
jgi:putative aldouronate transport system substrate-binding protein